MPNGPVWPTLTIVARKPFTSHSPSPQNQQWLIDVRAGSAVSETFLRFIPH